MWNNLSQNEVKRLVGQFGVECQTVANLSRRSMRLLFSHSDGASCGDGWTDVWPVRSGLLHYYVSIDNGGKRDDFSPKDVANVIMGVAHEILGHCKQFEDMRTVGEDDFLFEVADHFVANQGDGRLSRYRLKYSDDVTEIAANHDSIFPTVEFLDERFPTEESGVDWWDVVLDIWKERSSHAKTRFAPHGEDAVFLGFLPSDMSCHLEQCLSTGSSEVFHKWNHDYEPRGVYPTVPGDKVYEYLRTKASDDVVSLWRDATDDWQRNVISCAVFVCEEPGLANVLFRGEVSSPRFVMDGLDVLADVRTNQVERHDRCAAEILSAADVRFLFRDVVGEGARFDARGADFGRGPEAVSVFDDTLLVEPLGIRARDERRQVLSLSDDVVCDEAMRLVGTGLLDVGGSIGGVAQLGGVEFFSGARSSSADVETADVRDVSPVSSSVTSCRDGHDYVAETIDLSP